MYLTKEDMGRFLYPGFFCPMNRAVSPADSTIGPWKKSYPKAGVPPE